MLLFSVCTSSPARTKRLVVTVMIAANAHTLDCLYRCLMVEITLYAQATLSVVVVCITLFKKQVIKRDTLETLVQILRFTTWRLILV